MNKSFLPGLLAAPLILLVLWAGFWGWRSAFDRLLRGKALLQHEPRRESPWGLVDLLIAFVLLVACPAFLARFLSQRHGIEVQMALEDLSPDARAMVLLGAALASAVACVLSVIAVWLRTGATPLDFGLDRRQVTADLRLGGITFVMLAPIVYAVQMLLVQLVESKHPLIELLQEHPDIRFFAVSGVAALVVAPIVEEYFFRVLLQGWLERVAHARSGAVDVILGGRAPGAESRTELSGSEEVQETAHAGDENPYRPPSTETAASVTADVHQGEGRTKLWPILVSSLLFALAHYSHGPDPIPLFVLAVGLGYLYQRTHRILPCVVVHFLLNACSLAVLWVVVYFGD